MLMKESSRVVLIGAKQGERPRDELGASISGACHE